MKFKKSTPKGQCSRMRCTEPEVTKVDSVLGPVAFCEKHAEESLEYLASLLPSEVQEPTELQLVAASFKESADSIAEIAIDSQEDFTQLVGSLHATLDEIDDLETDRKAEGREHYDAFKAVNDRYREALERGKELADNIKVYLSAYRQLQEEEQDLAVQQGRPVPELFNAPGLTFESKPEVTVVNFNQVPAGFRCEALNAEAVMEALNGGIESIPGLKIEWKHEARYRRSAQ